MVRLDERHVERLIVTLMPMPPGLVVRTFQIRPPLMGRPLARDGHRSPPTLQGTQRQP